MGQADSRVLGARGSHQKAWEWELQVQATFYTFLPRVLSDTELPAAAAVSGPIKHCGLS